MESVFCCSSLLLLRRETRDSPRQSETVRERESCTSTAVMHRDTHKRQIAYVCHCHKCTAHEANFHVSNAAVV